MQTWLHDAQVVDLRNIRGNGPFHTFLGVILHVNADEDGTSDSFFAAGPSVNPDSVTPNFQVYKDGSIHQYLPFDWEPWAQVDGNFNYAAIETAGQPDEALTKAQLRSCALIVSTYHAGMGLHLQVADTPGDKGLGTHKMGGAAWGGHSCPGEIRTGQRKKILSLARGNDGSASTPATMLATPHGPHLRRPWPDYMHANGQFFGLISGPDESHGGINAAERSDVKAIQLRLQVLGFAPNVAGWADGIFERPTKDAVTLWQHAHMPETEFFGEVWPDDWSRLFTY
jgi:N-acetylmuramoyl-L-alanine amidase